MNSTARLALERRAAHPLPQAGGSAAGAGHGGIHVIIPGLDAVHVPEHLGLSHVLVALAQVSMLDSARLVADEEEDQALIRCMAQTLEDLREELTELEMPARPRLAALAGVTQANLAAVERALSGAQNPGKCGADEPAWPVR